MNTNFFSKSFYIILLIAVTLILGCESGPTTLDWHKTISQQKLKFGDSIKVHGTVFSLKNYDFDSEDRTYLKKKVWDSTLILNMYFMSPYDDGFDPNIPIGAVICRIYNPAYNETLKQLHDAYPDRWKFTGRTEYEFEFVGTIHSFKRERVLQYEDKPDLFLPAVHINVDAVKVLNIKGVPAAE